MKIAVLGRPSEQVGCEQGLEGGEQAHFADG